MRNPRWRCLRPIPRRPRHTHLKPSLAALSLPAPIADLDTRFFRSDKTGRLQGGLFGLDAVHPTTVGYGIIAQSVLDVLGAAGITSPGIDFTRLLAQDTLNTNPPALFTQVLNLIGRFLVLLVSRP